MNHTSKIQCVNDAIESIHFCGFEKGQMLFRGQADYHWRIDTSLFRVCNSVKHAQRYEAATIEPLLLKIQFPYLHSYDPIEHLMNAQHFGIPTRLLDWSYDILIALFFACYDKDEKYIKVDGRVFLIQSGFFNTFLINSSEQRVYKSPIDIKNIEPHTKRLSLNGIHIVNPVIRNSRMRIQDGCFMFFPWVFQSEDTELLTLQRYIQEHRKFVDQHNCENEKQLNPIFLVEKRVDYKYKTLILEELDKNYGISEKSIMVDCLYTQETETYYSKLKEYVEIKSRDLMNYVEN